MAEDAVWVHYKNLWLGHGYGVGGLVAESGHYTRTMAAGAGSNMSGVGGVERIACAAVLVRGDPG